LDTFNNAFLPAAALAALTGLAWIAYKHPKEFRPIGLAIAFLTTIAADYLYGYQNGLQSASYEMTDTSKNIVQSAKAVSAQSILSGTINLYVLGTAAFVWFLLSIPLWLKKD